MFSIRLTVSSFYLEFRFTVQNFVYLKIELWISLYHFSRRFGDQMGSICI